MAANYPWSRNQLTSFTELFYALNSGYQKTPVVTLNIINKCIVTVTKIISTTEVYSRLLSGIKVVKLKDYLEVSMTKFNLCKYESQNLYSDIEKKN
jgi:hypothetical protein